MPKTLPLPEARKLLGLEGLRFLATLAVLLWHYQHFALVAEPAVKLTRSELPFYRVLFPFYEAGEYGVWFFWCVSGFIFFWKYRTIIADRTVDGRSFFVNRLLRLYPLHIATLLLVAVLQPVYFAQHGVYFVYPNNDLPHFLAQLFMASDWLPPRSESFNGPIWSVSVEIMDYATFFMALRFVTASPLFNLVVILASITIGTQVGTSLAFFYAGGLAAMARQAVVDSGHRRTLEATAAFAAIAVPAAIWLAGIELAPAAGPLLLIYTPILLLFRPTHLAAAGPGTTRDGRQYDLFLLSSALPDSARHRTRLRGHAATDSLRRPSVLGGLRAADTRGLAPYLSLVRGAGAAPDPQYPSTQKISGADKSGPALMSRIEQL
ncbi:acyltransferase family protein [Bradyrhizobium sp. CAR08]